MKMYGYEVKYWDKYTEDEEIGKGITSGDNMTEALNNVIDSYSNNDDDNIIAIYIVPFSNEDSCMECDDIDWFFKEPSHVS